MRSARPSLATIQELLDILLSSADWLTNNEFENRLVNNEQSESIDETHLVVLDRSRPDNQTELGLPGSSFRLHSCAVGDCCVVIEWIFFRYTLISSQRWLSAFRRRCWLIFLIFILHSFLSMCQAVDVQFCSASLHSHECKSDETGPRQAKTSPPSFHRLNDTIKMRSATLHIARRVRVRDHGHFNLDASTDNIFITNDRWFLERKRKQITTEMQLHWIASIRCSTFNCFN